MLHYLSLQDVKLHGKIVYYVESVIFPKIFLRYAKTGCILCNIKSTYLEIFK